MTTEGQWEHPCSTLFNSLDYKCHLFSKTNNLPEGERTEKQVYAEHWNRSPSKTIWFRPPPKPCPWQIYSREVTEIFQSPSRDLCLQKAGPSNITAAAT